MREFERVYLYGRSEYIFDLRNYDVNYGGGSTC